MPDYKDAGHRPHARHDGEVPRTAIDRGPDGLKVSLDNWGPIANLFPVLYDQLQSNWGEAPSNLLVEVGQRRFSNPLATVVSRLDTVTGWAYMTAEEQAVVAKAFAGHTLANPLEAISFQFTVDGVSRACTHQLVRTRIGASYMQHGGRDNDWRHRRWTMPETIARACDAWAENHDMGLDRIYDGPPHCVTDWDPLDRYLRILNSEPTDSVDLAGAVARYLEDGKLLYAALVDAGIPWQDARRVLPMGTQTYIHLNYSYPALAGVLANRLEHIMDWEINCVAQLMLRELHLKCPTVMWEYLGSHSDKRHQAAFAGLDSWPPDGKWPAPEVETCVCGHPREAHHAYSPEHLDSVVTACLRCDCSQYRQMPLNRTHRPEQMPFWVLSPDAMKGGPIEWIPTNGTYPEQLKPRR